MNGWQTRVPSAKDGSRHPSHPLPQKPEPLALQDKSGPDSGPSQPVTVSLTQAQAGDSALNIAHEAGPSHESWNRPCTMLVLGLPSEAPLPEKG